MDILLDTHIALWLDSGDAKLRPATRQLIDRTWRDGGNVLLSAVSAWEIALLVEAGHIALDLPPASWVRRFGEQPGVEVKPLTYWAACRACDLRHLDHRDPADRLLIATAIELGCPLVTYDHRIVTFAEHHGSQYGFAYAG